MKIKICHNQSGYMEIKQYELRLNQHILFDSLNVKGNTNLSIRARDIKYIIYIYMCIYTVKSLIQDAP